MAQYKAKLNPFTGQLQLVPTNIALAIKEGVDTQGDLPLSGNAKGDARIANDTGHLYVWSLESATGLLTDWIDAGDIVDLTWDAITGKPSSSVVDIDDAVSKKHSQDTDKYLTTQVTKTLYVDKNRTDSYTENGSLTKPFKTIMGAVNQVIANGDNSISVPYVIEIGAGIYDENIILENVNLKKLKFIGQGRQVTQISPKRESGIPKT